MCEVLSYKYVIPVEKMFVDRLGKIVDENRIQGAQYVFFGASTRNLAVISLLGIDGRVLFYIDSDEKKAGNRLDGYEIRSLSAIADCPDIVIISVLTDYIDEVLESIDHFQYKECYFYFSLKFEMKYATIMNTEVLNGGKKAYKHIHFFTNDKFVRYFYTMAHEHFDMSEHLFIIDYMTEESEKGFVSFEEIVTWNKLHHNLLIFCGIGSLEFISDYNCNSQIYSYNFLELLRGAKKIWLHSAWFEQKCMHFISQLLGSMSQKIHLICHGGEVDLDKSHDIYVYILSKIQHVYAGMLPREKLMENYGLEADLISFGYFYLSNNLIKKISCSRKECDDIYILLGHSAYEYNNHLQAIDILKKFSEQKIKVICPLSYGDMEYRKTVIEKGKQVFQDKFFPITEFQTIEDYHVMLSIIDVAFFPMTTRMAGHTTIEFLNVIGKKIYMYDEIKRGVPEIPAISIEKVKDMAFDEFVSYKVLSSGERYDSLYALSNKNVNRWKRFLDI